MIASVTRSFLNHQLLGRIVKLKGQVDRILPL